MTALAFVYSMATQVLSYSPIHDELALLAQNDPSTYEKFLKFSNFNQARDPYQFFQHFLKAGNLSGWAYLITAFPDQAEEKRFYF